MAYLGVTPTTSSQSLVKQDFSVSATQNYTLSQSVTNANDIALYINNVRQEPTYAYSASGTSLTLTEATAGSDDMYCIYLGRAVGTINPASGSVGTSQLADGSVSIAKLSATGTASSSTFLRGDNSFAEAGGGKVLQVVNVHDDQYASYSSTNVDNKVQVLTASITPSATSSKILITGFISMSSTNSSVQTYGVTIKRGSTIIGEGDASSWNSGVGTGHSIIAASSYSKPDKAPLLHFLDSPNTTSATTYNFFAYANHYGSSLSSLTLIINGGGYTYNNKETAVPTSNITLMEIGA
tara:strand:- start:808 stop:1695 length:888 start_codon:yes stop_codon:yes gene_type:complete